MPICGHCSLAVAYVKRAILPVIAELQDVCIERNKQTLVLSIFVSLLDVC